MKSVRIVHLASATAAATFLATGAFAQPLSSPATVHGGPGPKWPVIAQIPAGADVNVVTCGQGWKSAWCQVEYGDAKGFVRAGVLAPSGRNDVIVAPVETNDLANLRRGPGPRWVSLAAIPPYTPVDLHYCSHGWRGDWCKVSYEGKVGFVHGSLLERRGALFPL
jgi:uncharacterized protein YraI